MAENVEGPEVGLELDRLKRIPPPPPPPEDAPEPAAVDEAQHLAEWKEQEKFFHEKEMHALERRSFRQDVRERKKYANKIFVLLCAWLGAVFVLLILEGIEQMSFKLSDGVLLAVVGGTTANVLGIFIVVANYLFPNPRQPK